MLLMWRRERVQQRGNKKAKPNSGLARILAEREGFEPSMGF